MSSKILIISALSSQGEGIAKDNSKVYFVRGALPGQKVLARIVQEKDRYIFADTERILEDTYNNRVSICPHNDCGGCALQSMPLEEEEQCKKDRILADFRKIAKIPAFDLEIISSDSIQYRNKMEFAFGYNQNGEKSVGLYQSRSSILVPVTQCALVPSLYMDILSLVREHLKTSSLPLWHKKRGFWRYIVIRHSLLDKKYLVHCITGESSSGADLEIQNLARSITQLPSVEFVHSERKNLYDVAFGEKILFASGEDYLEEALIVNGKETLFRYGVNNFFQVNTQMASMLFQEVASHIPLNSHFVDLCCGVGSIGLSCSSGISEIYGIENMASSIYFAEKNAQINAISHSQYVVKNIKDITSEELKERDCVCVDPPRAGLHKDIILLLCKERIPVLIYISCNPSTLARDIILLSTVYEIKMTKAFNMFRFSPHVETLVIFAVRE